MGRLKGCAQKYVCSLAEYKANRKFPPNSIPFSGLSVRRNVARSEVAMLYSARVLSGLTCARKQRFNAPTELHMLLSACLPVSLSSSLGAGHVKWNSQILALPVNTIANMMSAGHVVHPNPLVYRLIADGRFHLASFNAYSKRWKSLVLCTFSCSFCFLLFLLLFCHVAMRHNCQI